MAAMRTGLFDSRALPPKIEKSNGDPIVPKNRTRG
jgi:hypothetical protein